MLKWLEKLRSAVLFAFCLLLILPKSATSSEPNVSYKISDIKTVIAEDTITYNIAGGSLPVYTVSERFTPFRVIVDIAGAFFESNMSPAATKIPENSFASVIVTELKDQQPPVMRFEFTLSDSHDYSVSATNSNLEVKLFPATAAKSSSAPAELKSLLTLKDFKISSTPNSTTISILASSSIEKYTVDTIGGGTDQPPRMYIDINDVTVNELTKEKQIGTSVAKVRVAPRDKGVRIVFDSATSEFFKYTVVPSPQGLDVVIDESQLAASMSKAAKPSSGTVPSSDATLDALIGSSEKLLNQPLANKQASSSTIDKASTMEQDFSFSGYKKQRISIDFYKIDIHNVFRLFRQISDLNIIVDEDVSGSLTLALTDVPWDFALDIILNLMDLKKEERFNTIVIYPNKKDFVWPTRADDSVTIKADMEVIEQETLVIEQAENQPAEIVQARDLIVKAQDLEKNNSYEEAASLYAEALKLWPDNEKLSNRLTTLYLVNLGMNAKAVFHAKESLKLNPKNTSAALYAAIGSANMQRLAEASEYFSQSISDSPPMREALISYAAFSENNGMNQEALKLLEKYHSAYGETLDTMVGKARILDKLGKTKEAAQHYKAILTSGFQIRPDLKKYIEGRLAAKELN